MAPTSYACELACLLSPARDAILRRQWPDIRCSSIPAAAPPKLEEGNVSNAKSKRGTGAIRAASA